MKLLLLVFCWLVISCGVKASALVGGRLRTDLRSLAGPLARQEKFEEPWTVADACGSPELETRPDLLARERCQKVKDVLTGFQLPASNVGP